MQVSFRMTLVLVVVWTLQQEISMVMVVKRSSLGRVRAEVLMCGHLRFMEHLNPVFLPMTLPLPAEFG